MITADVDVDANDGDRAVLRNVGFKIKFEAADRPRWIQCIHLLRKLQILR
jgi:hypothetical protein